LNFNFNVRRYTEDQVKIAYATMEQCIGALVALCLRQGLPLVHSSPQPEPFLSLTD